MEITYFIRSKYSAISIGKLFRPLIAEIGKTEKTETYYMPSASYGIKGIIQNLFFTFRHRNRYGINHITGDCHFIIFALIGCKTVLTVHDLGFFTEHLHEMSWLKRKYLYYLQIYFPIKMADVVIAISEKTKEEILSIVPFKRKIDIAKHVSIDGFPFVPKPLRKEKVRVMQCGTGPNKNLETTIRALARSKYELRVIKKMTDTQRSLAEECNVIYSNVYNLTDEEMAQEYQNADIVVMPSLYEGFGVMVIEAQATGRPVITSGIEPMISVSGRAAFHMKNPLDADEMREAIEKIVADDNYRIELIQAGLDNSKKYTLANCAKEHLELYETLS